MAQLPEKAFDVASRSFVLPHLDLLLDAILQHFIDGAILVHDRSGAIIWMSEQTPDSLNVSRGSLLHKSFFEAIPLLQLDKRALPRSGHPVHRVIADHSYKQIQPFFCLYQRQGDDQYRPFVLRTARVVTAHGHPISYVVQLREAQRQLDVKDMNRSFVSLAAHQLKTPAGVIQGFLEMALQKPASLQDVNRLQRYLLAAYEANRSLIRTAKDLLNATKITGGLVEPEVSPFDLSQTLRLKLAGYRQWLLSKQVRFQVSYEMNGRPVVATDSTIVSELFDILLHNAIKFVPQEGMITLRTRRVGNHVELTVQDNGPGLKAAPKPAEDDQNPSASGSGLGLHLARQFAALIKGELVHEPIEPHGTRFRLRFPDLK